VDVEARDATDRAIALDLQAQGKATEEDLAEAVAEVRERRERGEEAWLLEALVARGVLTSEAAAAAREAAEADWWADPPPKPASFQPEPPGLADPPPGAPSASEGAADASPEPPALADPPLGAPSVRKGGTGARPASPSGGDTPEPDPTPPSPSAEPPALADPPLGAPSVSEGATETRPAAPSGGDTPEPDPTPPSPSSEPPAPARPVSSRRLAASASARVRFERASSPAPKIAVAVLLLGGAAAGGWALTRPDPADPDPSAASAEEGAPAAEETPRYRLVTVPQAVALLDRLEAEGEYDEAVRLIETCPAELALEASDELKPRLERLRRAQAYAGELEALLAAGPSRALERWVVRSERYELGPERQRLAVVSEAQERARDLLGAERYEQLVLFGLPEEDDGPRPPEEDEDDDVEVLERPRVAATEQIGSEERRERFAREAEAAAERVEAARERIATERAAREARFRAEAARARADPRPVAVPPRRGRDGWQGVLVAYDPTGFTVDRGGLRRRFTWADAPAATAVDVLRRGIDPDDADGWRRVGERALVGARFDEAREAFARARELDPALALPDVADLEPLGRVLHAEGETTSSGCDVVYEFEDPDELLDWEALAWSEVGEADGGVDVRSADPESEVPAVMAHGAVVADRVTVELRGAQGLGGLLVGFGSSAVVVGPEGAEVASWADIYRRRFEAADAAAAGAASAADEPEEGADEPEEGADEPEERPVAEPSAFFEPGETVVVEVLRRGAQRVEVRVRLGQEELLVEEASAEEGRLELVVGAPGGRLLADAVRVAFEPNRRWFERTEDAIPFVLEQALHRWRLERDAGHGEPQLPPRYAETSAEDPEALAGVPARARRMVDFAREFLAIGIPSYAARALRDAVAAGRGRYWAAEYLLAVAEVDDSRYGVSLAGPRTRLERAIAGVEDFYEARAARADILLREGLLEEAAAEAERAIATRPDYAPARLALAKVLLQLGELDHAVEEARLAAELAPSLRPDAEQIEAVRDGPTWNEPVRRETDDYVVTTDMPERADAFVAELERVRRVAPEVFPYLAPREGARPPRGRVYVFRRAEDFYRYRHRTAGRRGEKAAGVFTPWNGQLLLFDSPDEDLTTLMVLRHEAVHQWVHTLGLELPYWLNEAIADYLGGVGEVADGRFETVEYDWGQVRYLWREREDWYPLFDLMTMSPAEFYSGDAYLKYAQAWSFVHYCLEGGDRRLKAALFAYLHEHNAGRAGDRSRQLGMRLEHAYAATFHQLDMDEVEAGWRAHVAELARRAPEASRRR